MLGYLLSLFTISHKYVILSIERRSRGEQKEMEPKNRKGAQIVLYENSEDTSRLLNNYVSNEFLKLNIDFMTISIKYL